MKTSELIEKLRENYIAHGDLPVRVSDSDILRVRYNTDDANNIHVALAAESPFIQKQTLLW